MQAEEYQWVARGNNDTGDAGDALACWQAYDPSVKVELTSTALLSGGRLVFIDPIPLAETALAELTAAGTPAGILLTNGNHERAASALAKRFEIPIFAAAEALPEFSPELPARAFAPSDHLFDLAAPISLPGAAPGETAFYWPGCGGVLIFGDAVINLESTGLAFLPGRYCTNARLLHRSARERLAFPQPIGIVAFAHGTPIVTAARERLSALLGK